MSFKIKLILSYIIVISVSFILIAFFIDKNLEARSLSGIKSSLINQANLIVDQILLENLRKEDGPDLQNLIVELSRKAEARLTVIDTNGKVLADSGKDREGVLHMENHMSRPEVREALSGNIGMDTHYSKTLKMDMLYIAFPLKDKNDIAGAIRLALSLESIDMTLFAIRKVIVTGFLFALIFSIVLGLLVAAHIIRPINDMIRISRKYSEGDFSRRVIYISRDELGQLANTLNKMAQDIEDKMRQIGTQNQRLSAIFNSMVEGVVVVDKSGHIISINPAIEKIFGITREKVEGALFLEAIRNNEMWEIVSGVLKTGRAVSKEASIVYPVNKVFRANAAPIFDALGVAGCLIVTHDITEMKRMETVRSDFVANVSHELKTPLTSIKGFVETLLDGALDDRENARSFLKIIQEHALRLEGLVDDLLSLAHLESEGAAPEKKDIQLKKQTDQIIFGFAAQAKRKDIKIENDLPPGLVVNADRKMIDQVLTNLIDNAIKFNKEKGAIRLFSRDTSGGIKIIIEDSGMGIPEKDIARVFERFYRVDKARSRQLGGTGLGLSIVKHIVELHGGAVGVDSIEGLGSKFWFTLPK
ncbi:MAG: ATP-binding protein [Candidatus Omnitrophica bacterium]|nr:ATP-binding protein [Candidatus Omnitrophota bacterium]